MTFLVRYLVLVAGLDAGVYTYEWGRALSRELFSKFALEGILNPKTGLEYRNKILGPGGSQDAFDMIDHFLGRTIMANDLKEDPRPFTGSRHLSEEESKRF